MDDFPSLIAFGASDKRFCIFENLKRPLNRAGHESMIFQELGICWQPTSQPKPERLGNDMTFGAQDCLFIRWRATGLAFDDILSYLV